jgi:(p)ppGpp synthase/HD superfamily hydrolase
MEDSILTKEFIEAFRPIVEMNNAQFRQVKTMLAGFIATQERDLNYMDEYMDTLFNFMDPLSDTEMVIRQYYDYIATFNAAEAKDRIGRLEDDMGYMSKIIYAAGMLAKYLHRGLTDKGGNDYFESHLLKVASDVFDWKEKVVGFLHDAAEDCNVTVDDVMAMLYAKISEVSDNPQESWWEEEWWEEWMEDIAPYPCKITHLITDNERDEIKTALNLLNLHTAPTREEYIERISNNRLALRVKMADLKNNMDISRIPEPTEKDLVRIERYKKEYEKLLHKTKSRYMI